MASEINEGGNESRNLSSRVNIDALTVNGRVYVAGLYWHSLESLRDYKREAREFGQAEGMDVVTFRHTPNGVQAGFAPRTAEQQLQGAYSLAAALAQRLGDNWLALFEIDAAANRYAFAAAKDGDILTRQDVIGDRATLEKQFRRQWAKVAGDAENSESWGRIVVPENFGFEGEHLSLEDLLAPKLIKKSARLAPLKPWEIALSRGQKVAVVCGVLTLPALVFGGLYLRDWMRVRAAQEAARLHPPKPPVVRVATVLKKPPMSRPHPWAQMPGAEAVITACTNLVGATPLSVGGWRLNSVTCTPGQVQATYQRPPISGSFVSKPTIAAFQQAASAVFNVPLPISAVVGDAAMVSLNLKVPGATQDETLDSLTTAMVAFPSHWQRWGLDPKLQLVPDAAPPKDGNDYLPPTWTAYSFEVSSGFSPATLFEGVTPTGLRITGIDLNVTWPAVQNDDQAGGSSNGPQSADDKGTTTANILTWKIKGEIYASR